MSKETFGGNQSTPSVTLEQIAPSKTSHIGQVQVDPSVDDNSVPDLAVDAAEPTAGSATVTNQLEPPTKTSQVDRQLIGQILFGLALGSLVFFLVWNSGEEVVDANLPEIANTAEVAELPTEEEPSSNFGIGELGPTNQPALPRSDLPGVTSPTQDPSQQAPPTVVVEIVGGGRLTSSASTSESSDVVDAYENDYPTYDDGAFDPAGRADSMPIGPPGPAIITKDPPLAPATSRTENTGNPALTATTAERNRGVRVTNGSVTSGRVTGDRVTGSRVTSGTVTSNRISTTRPTNSTGRSGASNTTSPNSEGEPDSDTATSSSTTSRSSTSVLATKVRIEGVVNDGSTSLQLSASPAVSDYSYCWTIGYETSGESSRFCRDGAVASSDRAPVLGNATVVLEVFDATGALLGSDSASLELLTQAVLQPSQASSALLASGMFPAKSKSRPELTYYCWKLMQGDVTLLHCGDNNIDSIDLTQEAFVAGPGLIRGQVFVGPPDARRLVGSEEMQIEFE